MVCVGLRMAGYSGRKWSQPSFSVGGGAQNWPEVFFFPLAIVQILGFITVPC